MDCERNQESGITSWNLIKWHRKHLYYLKTQLNYQRQNEAAGGIFCPLRKVLTQTFKKHFWFHLDLTFLIVSWPVLAIRKILISLDFNEVYVEPFSKKNLGPSCRFLGPSVNCLKVQFCRFWKTSRKLL